MDSQTVCTRTRDLLTTYGQNQPEFPAVRIVDTAVRQDGRWWYVPIIRDGPHSLRAHPFYDHLSALEVIARQELGIDVLLVPARAA
ncbi:MAG: hypothetical protein HZB16_06045 [Armatimonadetes bacterium]|nr:hypothetical protein [Armatimonadota bacterium]